MFMKDNADTYEFMNGDIQTALKILHFCRISSADPSKLYEAHRKHFIFKLS